MADTKISALSAETAAPGDEIPVNRGGVNYKITAGDILKQDSGTLTADAPALDLTQTWNDSGVTFTGLKFNATDTASASGSMLMDLQAGGTSKFKVDKTGSTTFSGSAQLPAGSVGSLALRMDVSTYGLYKGATQGGGAVITTCAGVGVFAVGQNNGIGVVNIGPYCFSTAINATADLILARDAANTLAQRNGTNAQTFRIYNTYTDASNYERGKIQWDTNVLKIGTEAGGSGTVRALEVQAGGSRVNLFGSELHLTPTTGGADTIIFKNSLIEPNSDNRMAFGSATKRWTNIHQSGYIETSEMTAPSAPAADKVRIYAEDNGSGKTRLMALFPTGAAQQIAIEP